MNKTLRILGAVSAGVVLSSTLASCGGGSSSDGDEVKVGAILSLTGGGAVFGEAEKKSMELAVATVNKNGGANGKKIKLIIQDDKSQPSEAVTVARSLITQDQVTAIFGASSGSSTLAFLPVATSSKIPVLAPNSTVEVVEKFKEGVYRTTPVDTVIVEGTLKYLADQGLKKIGLLTESAAFGAQAGDAIEKQAPANGVEVVSREDYDPTTTDLKPELTKIRSKNPDVVVVWGTGPAPSVAFKNMRELNMSDLPRLAPLGVATQSNIKLADGAMDGVMIPGVIDSENPANDAEKKFVDTFNAKYKSLPTTLDAIAWDPAFLYAEAADKAGSTEASAVQKALDDLCDFEGVVGDYCYSKSHDGLGTDAVTIVKIDGTKFVSTDSQ